MQLAERDPALRAPACLLSGLGLGIGEIDFVEVLGAATRRTYFRHGLRNVDKL